MIDMELDEKAYEAKLAADHEAGPGARPSVESLNQLVGAAKTNPSRRISLVG